MNHLLLLIFLTPSAVLADLYTSYNDMLTLVDTNTYVSSQLRRFLDDQESRIRASRKIVNDFELVAEYAKQDPQKFIGSPLNAFLVIKKLTKDLQKFVDTHNVQEELKAMVARIKENHNLPTNDDYYGTATAIHRLEDTFKLEPSVWRNSSKNLSEKYKSPRALSLYEIAEIGRVAYEQQDHYHTITWMSEALKKLQEEDEKNEEDREIKEDGSPTRLLLLDYLAYAHGHQGNLKIALDMTKEMLEIDPVHERALGNIGFYKRELKERTAKLRGDVEGDQDQEKNEKSPSSTFDPFEYNNIRPESQLGKERDYYELLCRESNRTLLQFHLHHDNKHYNSNKNLDKLVCKYVTRGSPLLLIRPVKQEQVFVEPDIWVFHDVITEKDVKIMKELGAPKLERALVFADKKLKRATVRSPETGKYETANYRISKSAWLTDQENPRLAQLRDRVSAITHLSMDTAEEWQISNYGVGGQYEPHYDFARATEVSGAFDERIGNRIATWLLYLESPEKGGATVFPRVGARVEPKRRSAVFWYNLLPNGQGDMRTRHAACPVLFGSKWVSNKWFHAVGQEFKRPCNMVPDMQEEEFIR